MPRFPPHPKCQRSAVGDRGQGPAVPSALPSLSITSTPLCLPVMLLMQTSPGSVGLEEGAGSFERGSGPTPRGLKEQWDLHRVPKDLWPLGRDSPEPGSLLPQALASGWGPLKFSSLQRPFPSPGCLCTFHRCSCGVLVELEARRSDHPRFPCRVIPFHREFC